MNKPYKSLTCKALVAGSMGVATNSGGGQYCFESAGWVRLSGGAVAEASGGVYLHRLYAGGDVGAKNLLVIR